jgi:hypothetical protein
MRSLRAVLGLYTIWSLLAAGHALSAQAWHRGDSLPLLRRATTQRLTRDADTLLAAWSARARGVVRTASVVEHGGTSVERVIRADELEVEVYGEAPNRHKQIIVAWRDTSFLPNRIRYHRDHLGIVANDFGATLRLGDGDEVRDVLHPLSPAGLMAYEFIEGDTLRIEAPGRVVRVVAVQVRPRDPVAPGTVGTLYLDIDRAMLVRFRFTFTPAAYRDPSVQDISVTLENALQEGARWLPSHQAIVIRRSEPILDLPLRTVLRADWSISDYALGVVHPAQRFTGFSVDGLRTRGGDSTWREPIAGRLAGLPDAETSIDQLQSDAETALGGRLLSGLPRTRVLARGISDLLTVNRVGGVTPALGIRREVTGLGTFRARVAVGTSDSRVLGRLTLTRSMQGTAWTVGASRHLADVGDLPTSSGLASSLATLVGGDDLGDWTLLERAWIAQRIPVGQGMLDMEVAREASWSVDGGFSPLSGSARQNPRLGAGVATVARLGITRRNVAGDGWHASAEAGRGNATWQRFALEARGALRAGSGRLQLAVEGGAGSEEMPAYRAFLLGGRHTLPGVPYRALGGQRMARVEVGWARPILVPTPPLPNARSLRLPSQITPFVAAGVTGGASGGPWRAGGAIETVAGLRLDLWGPLLRIEGGVSLRTGRFGVSVDAHPDWWPVM